MSGSHKNSKQVTPLRLSQARPAAKSAFEPISRELDLWSGRVQRLQVAAAVAVLLSALASATVYFPEAPERPLLAVGPPGALLVLLAIIAVWLAAFANGDCFTRLEHQRFVLIEHEIAEAGRAAVIEAAKRKLAESPAALRRALGLSLLATNLNAELRDQRIVARLTWDGAGALASVLVCAAAIFVAATLAIAVCRRAGVDEWDAAATALLTAGLAIYVLIDKAAREIRRRAINLRRPLSEDELDQTDFHEGAEQAFCELLERLLRFESRWQSDPRD